MVVDTGFRIYDRIMDVCMLIELCDVKHLCHVDMNDMHGSSM